MHRSCPKLSRNFRLFIFWSLFSISSRISISRGTTKACECFLFKIHLCNRFNQEKYIIFIRWAKLPWPSAGTKIRPKSRCSHAVIFVIYFEFQIKNAGGEDLNRFLLKIELFCCCRCPYKKVANLYLVVVHSKAIGASIRGFNHSRYLQTMICNVGFLLKNGGRRDILRV